MATVSFINFLKQAGGSPQDVKVVSSQGKSVATQSPIPAPVAQHGMSLDHNPLQNLLQNTYEAEKGAVQQIGSGFSQMSKAVTEPSPLGGMYNLASGAGQAVGGSINALLSPASGVIKSIGDIPVPKSLTSDGQGGTIGGNIMKNGINPIADAISNWKPLQTLTQKYPGVEQDLGNAITILTTLFAGKEQPKEATVSPVKDITPQPPPPPDGGVPPQGSFVKGVADTAVSKVKSTLENAPESIMQRVARISKGKQAKFEVMSGGDSVGKFLSDRGIFGNIDQVTTKLYERFQTSMNTGDIALEKLTGTFSPEPVKTALTDLVAREQRVSSPGAESPNLQIAQDLLNKFDNKGLTMKEINQAKRLYERNVKVDYLKSSSQNPEAVVKATNLDSAIREWQVKQAETLGLKNLPEIRKETQLSKQLLNDIGQEYAGAAGNNAMSLTDWIMLSGGDPTAIGGFLVKKALSSKFVQGKIAEFFNRGNPVKGQVQADLGISQIKQLPAPENNPISGRGNNNVVITPDKIDLPSSVKNTNLGTDGNGNIVVSQTTTINPKTGDIYVRDLKTGKSKVIPYSEISSSMPQSLQLPERVTPVSSPNPTTDSTNSQVKGTTVSAKEKQTLSDTTAPIQKIQSNKLPSNGEIKKQIAFRESGVSKTPYAAVNKNKNGTTDYGKYQVNSTKLKENAKTFLGKDVTPKEFLASPALQEKYMDATIQHLKDLGVTKLDTMLVLHHLGYSDISTKAINALKKTPEAIKYLKNTPNG